MYEFDVSPKLFTSNTIDLYKPKITHYVSNDVLHRKFADWIIDKTLEISAECGTTRLGLSSGSVLNEVYKTLANSDIFPPENIEIYATNEIYKTNSIQKQITQNLTKAKLEEARYYEFIDTNSDLSTVAQKYTEILDQFDDEEGFDICILQVNSKGEIAGLTANGKGLSANENMVVINSQNITISIPMILKSRHIALVIQDDNDILEEFLGGNKSATQFPVKILLAHPDVHIFYHLDI